jgi:hypothetical protein
MTTTKPLGNDWTEPESTFVGEYPYAHVTETESGHLFALDDTKDSETVRLAHRTGTFTEMQPDGTRVDKIVGDGYQIIAKNNHVLIKGVCNITIEGDSVLHVMGDADMKVDGDVYSLVEGNSTTQVKGDVSLFAGGDVDVSAGGTLGTVTINAPDGINLNGDVTVNGMLNAKNSIYSGDNILAGKQLFSYLGIQTLGGINSGFTSESPVPAGLITATVKVEAPGIVGSAYVRDSVGTMQLIRNIYNIHKHPAPKGPTGTPFQKQ